MKQKWRHLLGSSGGKPPRNVLNFGSLKQHFLVKFPPTQHIEVLNWSFIHGLSYCKKAAPACTSSYQMLLGLKRFYLGGNRAICGDKAPSHAPPPQIRLWVKVIVTSHGLIGFVSRLLGYVSCNKPLRGNEIGCISGDQSCLRMQEMPFQRPYIFKISLGACPQTNASVSIFK